jgi:hypothetical protein
MRTVATAGILVSRPWKPSYTAAELLNNRGLPGPVFAKARSCFGSGTIRLLDLAVIKGSVTSDKRDRSISNFRHRRESFPRFGVSYNREVYIFTVWQPDGLGIGRTLLSATAAALEVHHDPDSEVVQLCVRK